MIGVELALFCSRKIARRVPLNYCLLGLFTIGESWCLGYLTMGFNPYDVLAAYTMTIVVTLALTAYACLTKVDFTLMGGMIWVFAAVISMFCLFSLIFRSNVAFVGMTCLILVLYGLFLLYDT